VTDSTTVKAATPSTTPSAATALATDKSDSSVNTDAEPRPRRKQITPMGLPPPSCHMSTSPRTVVASDRARPTRRPDSRWPAYR
jgi:hypothetical protein